MFDKIFRLLAGHILQLAKQNEFALRSFVVFCAKILVSLI